MSVLSMQSDYSYQCAVHIYKDTLYSESNRISKSKPAHQETLSCVLSSPWLYIVPAKCVDNNEFDEQKKNCPLGEPLFANLLRWEKWHFYKISL